ncbi:MAG: hypothetical protein Q9195_008206 [Heterodermia aff. obscurata]
MEVVGFVASVGTLIEGADFIRRTLDDYRKGGRDRERLLAEVASLKSVLGQLKAGSDQARDDHKEEAWLDVVGQLSSKGGVLERIEDVISEIKLKIERKHGFRGALVQWTWPFVKEDVDRNIRQMQRLSHNVSLVLQTASLKYTSTIHERVSRVEVAANKRELRAILEWLSSLNFLKQQQTEFSKAFPGTCEWFLSSTEYDTWKQKRQRILYCSAIGGAGKTILASVAIDDLRMQTAGQDVGIFIIYCKHDRPDTHSVEKLAMTILRQVVQIKAGLIPPELEELLTTHYYTKDTKPDLDEVLKVVNSLLPTFSSNFVVLDGLDEIMQEKAREEIITFLMTLEGDNRIMFTSRPIDVIEKMFPPINADPDDEIWSNEDEAERYDYWDNEEADYEHAYDSNTESIDPDDDSGSSSNEDPHVDATNGMGFQSPASFTPATSMLQSDSQGSAPCLKVDVSARPRAIRTYVRKRTEQSPLLLKFAKQKPGFAEELEDEVTTGAKKMFLLAQLHMDAMSNPDLLKFSEVLQALRTLPTKLNDSYDKAMDRVQGHGKSLLRLVAYAQRPLSAKEVEHALGISSETDELLDEEIIPASALISRCAGLVTLDENYEIVFSHYTIDGYFANRRDDFFEDGHKYMAEICLHYLNLQELRNGPVQGEEEGAQFDARLKAYPFLEYASLFWGIHAHASQDNEALELAYDFIRNDERRSTSVQALWFSSDEITADWRSRTGASPLRLAMYFKYEKLADRLLKSGADANIQDVFGMTPLMWAAQVGDIEMTTSILQLPIPLNAINNDGETALHLAITHRHEDVTAVLVDQRDVDVNVPAGGKRGTRSMTPLMHAIWREEINIVRKLLTRDDILINSKDSQGLAAIHWAAFARNPEIMEALVKVASIDLEPMHDRTSPPLILAAYRDNAYAVRALLDAGANINIRESELDARGTALMRAADKDSVSVVHELLRRQIDWNAKDSYQRTAVHSAAINGSIDSLGVLLSLRDVEVNLQDINGNTPLHDAAGLTYDSKCLELLLSKGADIEIMNNRGKTAIDTARAQGAKKNIAILKKRYAEEFGMPKRSMTGLSMEELTLMQAAQQGDEAAVDSILTTYKQDKSIDIEERDDWLQRTPLQHAVDAGHLHIVQKLHRAGANINTMDKFGRTALHIAAMRHRLRIAGYLLDNGADYTIKDQWGIGAFEDASPSLEVLFLEHGAEFTKDLDLERVLFFAAEQGKMIAVQRLVDAGAEVQVKDSYGFSPYERAKQAGKTEMAKYLDQIGKSAEEPELSLPTPMTSSASIATMSNIAIPALSEDVRSGPGIKEATKGDFAPSSKHAENDNQETSGLSFDSKSKFQLARELAPDWRYVMIVFAAFFIGFYMR